MSQKLTTLALAMALSMTSSVFAATIVWVSDNKDPADGVPADQGWVDMLVSNGYTVNLDFSNGEAGSLDDARIAAFNAADLIIVSRNIMSSNYDDGAEPTQWNGITTPLILHPMHLARSSHWRWFNSTSIINGLTDLEAVDLLHPIFDDVPLSANNRVSIIQSQPSTIGFVTDVGNGKLLGQRADNGAAWIVEWEAGQEFYPGAGQTAGGRRMYFAVSGTAPDGTYNLTAEGEMMFLNAVKYMLGPAERVKAFNPTPANESIHEEVWAKLTWSPGIHAVSHDIYLGENPDDVNDGTGGTFRISQPQTFFFVGIPQSPYPGGLVPGTTYYWRIDEVNDADPNSPWKGDLWSFTVPSTKAYSPTPAEGARFIDPDVTLTWTPGYDSALDYLYFGTDEDAVRNATAASPEYQGPMSTTSFVPSTLEREKTYYWRVDGYDLDTTNEGDVWSFTTAREGGGIRGDYYNTLDFGDFVLTRTDPQINFNWGNESPTMTIEPDSFSVRWVGEVEAAFTETYTFYTLSDDGVRLWVDGRKLIDHWSEHGAIEDKGKIDLVAGNVYSILMEYYEDSGPAVAQLRWESPSTPKQLIPQAALSLPLRASRPNPANGATGVTQTPALTWNAGDLANSHDVYFGTDEDAVKNATTASPEHAATKTRGSESYEPGKLAWNTTYYWRVDQVSTNNPDSPWVGNVWSFATGDFIVVDDFEVYDMGENQIWYAWNDGLGYGEENNPPYYAGNGTGSEIGDGTTSSYTEETIFHSGIHSMPYWYNNGKPDKSRYSEAKMALTAPRDWSAEGVKALSLWFRGRSGSAGSFSEGPVGTYTMTATGRDIFDESDEFHFAYKTLNGVGSIVARVESIEKTDEWAKAGVMIRETLEPGSAFAAVYITAGYGCRFQARTGADISATSDSAVVTPEQTAITAPYWVKLERDAMGNFTGFYSSNGTTWEPLTWNPQTILMNSNVYVGLALTAHNTALTCEAVFSSVQTTGNVGTQWVNQDIGLVSNDPEPMYVAVANSTGQPAVVYWEDRDDPEAIPTQIDTWTEWNIDLKEFADQGIDLTDVESIAIGFGDRDNPAAGGEGKMYFDDIRLHRPRCLPDEVTLSEADLNADCVVDMVDLKMMAGDWLDGGPGLAADVNADEAVDLKDYAVLAGEWLDEKMWPQW
jgi:hypothetical protein